MDRHLLPTPLPGKGRGYKKLGILYPWYETINNSDSAKKRLVYCRSNTAPFQVVSGGFCIGSGIAKFLENCGQRSVEVICNLWLLIIVFIDKQYRPERPLYTSPGQRPGNKGTNRNKPCKGVTLEANMIQNIFGNNSFEI